MSRKLMEKSRLLKNREEKVAKKENQSIKKVFLRKYKKKLSFHLILFQRKMVIKFPRRKVYEVKQVEKNPDGNDYFDEKKIVSYGS